MIFLAQSVSQISTSMKILLWFTDKVIGGILTGLVGLLTALFIYRLMYYRLVKRERIKRHILEYLKLCNMKWEEGSSWTINTPNAPDGETLSEPIFPTTKAIMQWVRDGDNLYKYQRWGLKYDEEYFQSLLVDMHYEGRVHGIIDPKTGELIGWRHSHDEI